MCVCVCHVFACACLCACMYMCLHACVWVCITCICNSCACVQVWSGLHIYCVGLGTFQFASLVVHRVLPINALPYLIHTSLSFPCMCLFEEGIRNVYSKVSDCSIAEEEGDGDGGPEPSL